MEHAREEEEAAGGDHLRREQVHRAGEPGDVESEETDRHEAHV